MKKKYLSATSLTYEIIISKGKGKLTKDAENMIILLAERISRKLPYYNEDDRNDCKGEALYMMLKNWKGFDEYKFDNAFSYMTEICKRGFSKGLRELNGTDWRGESMKTHSLSEIYLTIK